MLYRRRRVGQLRDRIVDPQALANVGALHVSVRTFGPWPNDTCEAVLVVLDVAACGEAARGKERTNGARRESAGYGARRSAPGLLDGVEDGYPAADCRA